MINKQTADRLNTRNKIAGIKTDGKRSKASAPAKTRTQPAPNDDPKTTDREAADAQTKNSNDFAFFDTETTTPSPYLPSIPNELERPKMNSPEYGTNANDFGMTLPRLETRVTGDYTDGHLVAQWSSMHLGVELLPWQLHVCDRMFAGEVAGSNEYSTRQSLVSTARQSGKSSLIAPIIGAWLTTIAAQRGKPQTVLSTAHDLSLACQMFERVAPVLVDVYGAKAKWGYGRMELEMPDKSKWYVRAATPRAGHGLSCDLICSDEIMGISEEVLFSGLKPTQRARNVRTAGGTPMHAMFSTAGTQASTAMLKLREQGLRAIDANVPTSYLFMEWSIPPGVNVFDESYWKYANPALGYLVDIETIRDEAGDGDLASFMRASLNTWVSTENGFLAPGVWDSCAGDGALPAGGFLAVDSSLDGARYVAIRASADESGIVHVQVEFVVDTLAEMVAGITRTMDADPKLTLAITPSLDTQVRGFEKRRQTVGYGELLKFTGLVRSLITDGRLIHRGEEMLNDHMNRAVAVVQAHSLVLSSKRSPGSIELARCCIWAAALASQPRTRVRAAVAFAR